MAETTEKVVHVGATPKQIRWAVAWGLVYFHILVIVVVFLIAFVTSIAQNITFNQALARMWPYQSQPTSGMTHHGPNKLCEGRPKGVPFTCTPPGYSVARSCVCQ